MEQAPLANAELALMEQLWIEQPRTARELRESLYPNAAKAQHGTVQRLLQRLEEKGFVEHDTSLTAHQFKARVTKQAYASGQLENLTERLSGGSLAPLITHLIQERRLSKTELAKLRKLLDAHRPSGGKP